MCGVDARLAMNELVRLLIKAEEIAVRTRGIFYLKDPNQFPEVRAVLGARSDYVLSVAALAVPRRAATKRDAGVQVTQEESRQVDRNSSLSVIGPRETSIIVISDDLGSLRRQSEYQPHEPLSDMLEPGESWYREQ